VDLAVILEEEIMTAVYSISQYQCTLCEAERDEAFQKEAAREWPVTIERSRRLDEWQEFWGDWHAEHPPVTQTCFLFVADCGGDEIALCPECLHKIWKRANDQEAAMPGTITRWYAHEQTEGWHETVK